MHKVTEMTYIKKMNLGTKFLHQILIIKTAVKSRETAALRGLCSVW